jgi:hypothetical protein
LDFGDQGLQNKDKLKGMNLNDTQGIIGQMTAKTMGTANQSSLNSEIQDAIGQSSGNSETQVAIGQKINRALAGTNQSSRAKKDQLKERQKAAFKLAVSRDYFKEFEAHRSVNIGGQAVQTEYYGSGKGLRPGQESFIVHQHASALKKQLEKNRPNSKLTDNNSTYSGDPAGGKGGGKELAGPVDYNQLIKLAGKLSGGKGSLQNGPLSGADYADNGRLPTGQLPEAMGPMDYAREPGEEYADNQPAVLLGKKKPAVAAAAGQNKTAAGNGTSPMGGKMGDLNAKNLSAGGSPGGNSSANATKTGTNSTADPAAVTNNATGAAPGGKDATGADSGAARTVGAADLGPDGLGPAGGLANGMGAEGGDGAAPGGKVMNMGNGKMTGAAAGGKGSLPDLPNGKK